MVLRGDPRCSKAGVHRRFGPGSAAWEVNHQSSKARFTLAFLSSRQNPWRRPTVDTPGGVLCFRGLFLASTN